jgi:hypothetical protein
MLADDASASVSTAVPVSKRRTRTSFDRARDFIGDDTPVEDTQRFRSAVAEKCSPA